MRQREKVGSRSCLAGEKFELRNLIDKMRESSRVKKIHDNLL